MKIFEVIVWYVFLVVVLISETIQDAFKKIKT